MMNDKFITISLFLIAIIVCSFFVSDYVKKPKPDFTKSYPLKIDPIGLTEGNPDERLIVYNFFDYSCTYCKESSVILSKVQKELQNNFAIIHIPIPLEGESSATYKAAANSLCYYQEAGELTIHNYFYDWYNNLDYALNNLNEISVFKNTTFESYQSCMEQDVYKELLTRNKKIVHELDISSVPAMLITGDIFLGALPERDFRKLIKSYLD